MSTPKEKIQAVIPVARQILPSTATPLEVALLAVELASLAEIDVNLISTIWNPYKIPSVLLPWLAWALSVDVWNPEWNDEIKRDVIAASPEVHRLKGTLASVEIALKALGVTAKIEEWHLAEPVARRGTFKVSVLANKRLSRDDTFLSENTQRQIVSQIRQTKPLSRYFTVEVGAAFYEGLGVGSAFAALSRQDRILKGERPSELRSVQTIGTAFAGIQILKASFTG